MTKWVKQQYHQDHDTADIFLPRSRRIYSGITPWKKILLANCVSNDKGYQAGVLVQPQQHVNLYQLKPRYWNNSSGGFFVHHWHQVKGKREGKQVTSTSEKEIYWVKFTIPFPFSYILPVHCSHLTQGYLLSTLNVLGLLDPLNKPFLDATSLCFAELF